MSGVGNQPQIHPDSETEKLPVRIWFGKSPRTRIPTHPGYRLVGHHRHKFGQFWLAGLFLIPVWFVAFILLVRLLGGPEVYSGEITIHRAIFSVVVLVAVIAFHEGIHALAGLVIGGRPCFGAGPGYFFVTFYQPFSRTGFLTIALAPLIVISVGSIIVAAMLPVTAGWALLGSLFNISGSGGDLWMANHIRKQAGNSIFYDLADGFAVFVPAHKS